MKRTPYCHVPVTRLRRPMPLALQGLIACLLGTAIGVGFVWVLWPCQ